jgi:hypothetical protein
MAKRKRREHRTHLCRFSALDDLPAKQRSDPRAVLRLLAETGRFSCFEVDRRLADTLVHIEGHGWAVFHHNGDDYPWTRVSLTPAGEAEMARESMGD